MMRKFAQFLLAGYFLVIPALAQRGGGGFHGGMGGFHGGGFAGSGFRGGFVHGGFGGFRGFYPGNRFAFGFGVTGYWPYYGAGWGYPYYAYPYSYYGYPYSSYSSYSYPYPYDYGYAYGAPAQTYWPPANGPLYLIKLTYQSNLWVTQNYWYTPKTLNFVTLQGELKKTPISSIDRAITFQINRDRGVNFQFPM